MPAVWPLYSPARMMRRASAGLSMAIIELELGRVMTVCMGDTSSRACAPCGSCASYITLDHVQPSVGRLPYTAQQFILPGRQYDAQSHCMAIALG